MANAIEKRRTSLEGLLHDIYDGRLSPAHCSLDTESFTDTSASDQFSGFLPSRYSAVVRRSLFSRRSLPACAFLSTVSIDEDSGAGTKFDKSTLWSMDIFQLLKLVAKLRGEVESTSVLLTKYLKRRERERSRISAKCNHVTAILQALSPKRSVDAKLQFTLEPPAGETGYDQWLNAMRSVARLPDGMPPHFRKRLWLTLADHYVKTANIDWEATSRRAFNDRMNDDDDELSLQIVKDLHRTGWSGLNGDVERVLLKRVLLAYARYNKTIGYCQGFNVIAALILEVMEYNEEPALKVMIMLIEHVLPSGYFDQTLRALSVDMAVLRDLVHQRLPRLSAHLDYLMMSSESEFEPPLTNVFSMQWFLTLFATCLPKLAVFRIWDSLMLEGSEILLRAALAIWSKVGRRIYKAKTADSYYTIMGVICQELLHMSNDQCNDLMQVIYTMAEFPYPGLSELRDRYTWNIQPFSSAFRLLRQQVVSILKSDDESGCDLVSISPKQGNSNARGFLTPPAQGNGRTSSPSAATGSASDLSKLEKQYKLMRQRQKQAAVILQNALASSTSRHQANSRPAIIPASANAATASTRVNDVAGNSDIFNHLYLSRAPNQTLTRSTFNGTVSVASRVVQPSGDTTARRPSKSATSKTPLGRMKSGDSLSSAETCTIVTPESLASPPSTPRNGSLSTPTSSGGGSTPGTWTPLSSPIPLQPVSQFGSGTSSLKKRRQSDGIPSSLRQQRPRLRRCKSCSEVVNSKSSYPRFSSSLNGPLSQVSSEATISAKWDLSSIPSRPSTQTGGAARTKQYKRPPPLDLRKLSNGSSSKPQVATSNSVRSRFSSTSSNATNYTISTSTNGVTPASSKVTSTMLKKSKAILASISPSIEEDTDGENRRSNNATRNPFPVKRKTALIERGKRLGLYS